jgi:NAD(P)-dependent dehydrogenase (short-subunit alcohol dehydrogenase family)
MGVIRLAAVSLASTLIFGAQISRADTVLITGANSGIGLEFAKQYATRNWSVIATHRHTELPDSLRTLASQYKNVRVEYVDVASVEAVSALARTLQGVAIDVLINNAAVYAESNGDTSTQNFGQYNFALMDTVMAINVKGPLMMTQTFLPNVKASRQKKIISISSTNGSLTRPYPGTNAVFYRASKAALNCEMQVVAHVLQPEGVTVLLMHPGAVRTERIVAITKKFGSSVPEGALDPAVSVAQMIATIDKVSIRDTGRFLQYDGIELAW